MDIEVRHLRLICAIADTGSLSKAAAEMGLSQPSVSSSLRRLEEHLSGRLFDRSHRGVISTDFGRQLLIKARIALAEIDQLETDLSLRGVGDPLHIGVAQMACTAALIRALEREFGRRTRFTAEASTAVMAHDLKRGRSDLSVVVVGEDAKHELPPEVFSRVLQPAIPVFVAMPEDHRLAGRREIDLADLAAEAWVGPAGADDGSLADLRTACASAGFTPDVRYRVPPGTGLDIVRTAGAIQTVEPSTPNGRGIVTRALGGDPIRMRLVLAWQRHHVRREAPDIAHRITMDVYGRGARSSESFLAWWRERRADFPWVKQLDAVFAP